MTTLPAKESLTVEFKSDRRCLPDRELLETVVCLANTEGGSIYLGVEDDGTPTGLHANHQDLSGLSAMVANRTVPPVITQVERLDVEGIAVARIEVAKAHQLTSTSDAVFRRRRLQIDGTPECVPFLPHEFGRRLSTLGLEDITAQPVPDATMSDLDAAERARLRQFIERFQGDRALLELDDAQLDGALGLTTHPGTDRVPTLAGLLLIGKEASLARLVPTHEVALQVLDGESVRFNQFTRAPLLRTFEWLETSFGPLNIEEEVQVGLFRVPVPLVERRAFREAIANALTHRDYSRLGAVHIRLERAALIVSNPGGFVEGVSLQNLLSVEPRPRNPRLADAFKRIGLVERTGRGVDLIYRGLLRYGRPNPDYGRSDAYSVALRMPTSKADLDFLRLILDQEQRLGGPLPIDSLIALASLRQHRRLTRAELAKEIQKSDQAALATLEALVERGLVAAHSQGRGRSYTLAPGVYAQQGLHVEYTRQAGFDKLQREQMVRAFVRQHGEIRRSDAMDLCQISGDQASRLLRKLTEEGALSAHGKLRWRVYSAGPGLDE